MTPSQEIVALIDGRLRELQEQIGALQAARAALGQSSPVQAKRARAAPTNGDGAESSHAGREPDSSQAGDGQPQAPRSSDRRPAQRRRRATAKRPAEVVPAAKLELLLCDSAGLTSAALAQRANANRDQVLALLRDMEKTGRVRRSGQRRGTRWHAISDDERVAQRAAELASRTRTAQADEES
ncbi:MAG: hypothetical protein ABSG43_07105 [Solirubrobacteraceae bacterium]|jgi:hypothetical protein